MPLVQTAVTVAYAFKVLFERGILNPYDLFNSDLSWLPPGRCSLSRGETPGIKITFNDGSVAFYNAGNYWLESEKQWCGWTGPVRE